MKLFLKNHFKVILPLILGVLLLVLMPMHVTHAASGKCNLFNFSLSACISGAFYAASYIVGLVAGIFIAIILWFIQVILQFNMNVVNTTLVQTGYSITLAIANLGFVLGIIIVALATILRQQTYGIKSILWKLVLMAILVNFALVIAAPIVGFANNLTTFFINAFPGGGNTVGSGAAGFDKLSSGIAGVFQPQRLIAPENNGTSTAAAINAGVQSAAGIVGTTIAGGIGVAMGAVTLVMMMIVLIVLFVMLVIRYLYLEVLLIMAPLAWMGWVFPKTSKYWSEWWDKFISQAFYPAILMFFLYLLITTGSNIGVGQNVQVTPTSSSWISGFFTAIGNGLLGPIVGTVINGLLMIGLMGAGLTMASKLSTAGSKVAGDIVGKVKDSVQGYATKKGKILGRSTAKKMGAETLLKNARTGTLGQGLAGKKFLGIPGTGFMGTAASKVLQSAPAQRLASVGARAAQPYLSNADVVDQAKKGVSENPEQVKEDLKGGLSFEEKLAHLLKLVEKGEVDRDTMVGKQKVGEFLDQNAGAIKDYGQGKLIGDANKRLLSDTNSREAQRAIERGDAQVKVSEQIKDELGNVVYEVGDMADAVKLRDASVEKLIRGLTREDATKANVNAIFGPSADTKDAERLLGQIGVYNPHLLGGFLKNMKGPTIRRVKGLYPDIIEKMANRDSAKLQADFDALDANTTMDLEEKNKKLDVIFQKQEEVNKQRETLKKTFERLVAAMVLGMPLEASPDGTPPPPPPAP